MPRGHFPLALVPVLGVRAAELRQVLVQTATLPFPPTWGAQLHWPRVLQLFVAGGGEDGAFIALLRPLDPPTPPAIKGEGADAGSDANGRKEAH